MYMHFSFFCKKYVVFSNKPVDNKSFSKTCETRAVWSESLLIACAFCSLRAIQRGMNENPYYSGWMYRLIWVFAGHRDLIVGFVTHWLYCKQKMNLPPFLQNFPGDSYKLPNYFYWLFSSVVECHLIFRWLMYA